MKKTILWMLLLSLILSLSAGCRLKEPEPMPIADYWATYRTMNEFTEAYKAAKQRQKSGEELTQDDVFLLRINTVYQPVFDLSEYTLNYISVNDYNLQYWYSPADLVDTASTSISICITFYHPKEGVDQFEQAVQQYRDEYKLEPTADGVLYNPTDSTIYFRVGTSCAQVTVPEAMNSYETILPLCQYEVLEIAETE